MLNQDRMVVDPMVFCHTHWPHIQFYLQQRDIIYSIVDNRETVVVAGNKLGS